MTSTINTEIYRMNIANLYASNFMLVIESCLINTPTLTEVKSSLIRTCEKRRSVDQALIWLWMESCDLSNLNVLKLLWLVYNIEIARNGCSLYNTPLSLKCPRWYIILYYTIHHAIVKWNYVLSSLLFCWLVHYCS